VAGSPPPDHHVLGTWEHYRLLADNSADVLLIADLDGVLEWVQPTIESLLGWRPDQVVGRPATELLHPDDLAATLDLRAKLFERAEEIGEIPLRYLTRDGGYRVCAFRGRPRIDGATGAVDGAVMTLRDPSPQLATLRALATLSRVGSVLVGSTEEQGLLDGTCRALVTAGQYAYSWYVRVVDDHLVPVASSGGEDGWLEDALSATGGEILPGAPSGRALATGETVVVPDLDDESTLAAWAPFLHRYRLRSSVALPVVVENEIDGALVVYSPDLDAFDTASVALLEDLAATVGYGVAKLRHQRERERLLLQSETERDRVRATLDSMIDPFVELDAVRGADGELVDLEYREANDAACVYNQLARDELIGRRLLDLYPGQLEHGPLRLYFRAIETGEPVVLDGYCYDNERLDDSRFYDIRAVRRGDGIALTWRDVTDRLREAVRIAEDERHYRHVAEHGSDVLWEIDSEGRIVWASESITRVLGWPRAELLGSSSLDLLHPDDVEVAAANRRRVLAGADADGEFRLRQRDGSYRWMSLRAHSLRKEGGEGAVSSLRDIDDEVRGRDVLAHVVRHDPITGAPTRAVLMAHVQDELDSGRPGVVALLCADIDGLSTINESLSYDAGDQVLAQVADRIAHVVDDWDLVGRGSGDELLVYLPGLVGADQADHVAAQIRDAVREPISLGDQQIRVSVSIGIATSTHAPDAGQLLRDAGVAMRQAQELGGDRATYVDPELAEYAARRLTLEQDIRDGLLAGEFHAWLQPIVSLTSGDVRGYEALVRWVRPGGAIVAPADFLPLAERTGLVVDLDRAVLDGALAALPHLAPGSTVAVNLSAASLRSDGLADAVLAAVERHGVDPRRLHLEVIETALLDDLPTVREHMTRLADAGVLWYVDDFGTGYSSISHLRDLPIAGLKLDRSFTFGVAEGDRRCAELSQALVGLAVGLGLDGVAEGVETEAVARTLAAHGWKHGQGWLFGRPAPAPTG
jgi:diguanylate cyclase (GGDEF)-like protein/PAS domain S-box-containing protein